MAKKEMLQIDQKIWLETVSNFGYEIPTEEKLEEMIVFEANKSSAYIGLDRESKVRYRVNQKTHQTKLTTPNGKIYHLWLSVEEYKQAKEIEREEKELREKIQLDVERMSFKQLKDLNDFLYG